MNSLKFTPITPILSFKNSRDHSFFNRWGRGGGLVGFEGGYAKNMALKGGGAAKK